MKTRILICDDDEPISEMLKIILEEEGYEVKLMQNGKAILKKVTEYQPNLILIDLWMPGIDGKEAVKLLKKEAQTSSIPIYIISALHESEISKIAKQIGANGYLLKPFNLDELLLLVKNNT